MAKRKKPKKPVTRRHRTVALKGMTPAEVEAWRKQEIRERAKEKKAQDEERIREGKKQGRPKGQKRLYREATRDERRAEIRAQKDERRRRAYRGGARAGAYGRIPKNVPQKSKSVRAGIQKTVSRVRGTGTWQKVVDALNALPKGTSAYVQLGSGYGAQAKWVGSKLTTPAEAAGWLEGIGLKYHSRIFSGTKPDDLFIEVVSYRKVKTRGPEKTRSAQPQRKAGARKGASAVKTRPAKTRRRKR